MRVRVFSLLLLGSLIAVVAGIATFSYTRSIEQALTNANAEISAYGEAVGVPVLLMDAPRGSKLTALDFGSAKVLLSRMPTNVLQSLPDFGADAYLVSFSDLRAGALLLDTQLGFAPPNADIGFMLSNDGRAVSVTPRNFETMSPYIKVDALLDLYWTRDTEKGSETRLIGNALRVLYLPEHDISAQSFAREKGLILEAGIRDAARILAASPHGFFSVLPAQGAVPEGTDTVEIRSTDLNDLPLAVRIARPSGSDVIATVAAPASDVKCHTTIVRAGHRSVVEVAC